MANFGHKKTEVLASVILVFQNKLAGWTGLEPAAFRVTGGRYNQLNYHPAMFRKTFYSHIELAFQQFFNIILK